MVLRAISNLDSDGVKGANARRVLSRFASKLRRGWSARHMLTAQALRGRGQNCFEDVCKSPSNSRVHGRQKNEK